MDASRSTFSQSFVTPQKWPQFGLVVSISAVAHLLGLLLWCELFHEKSVVLVRDEIVSVSRVSHERVVFNSKVSNGVEPLRRRKTKRLRKAFVAKSNMGTTSESGYMEALRNDAKRATTGLMAQLKFRLTYGFGPRDYELPVRKQGEVPLIPSSDLPAHFEQYLEIEVLIDTAGSVADAKVVHGAVDQAIEQRLISAIRQFKYIPAKYQGTPVPCEIDIVVHVPS